MILSHLRLALISSRNDLVKLGCNTFSLFRVQLDMTLVCYGLMGQSKEFHFFILIVL